MCTHIVGIVVCVACIGWADDWKWESREQWTVTETEWRGEHGNLNAVGMKPLTDFVITGEINIAQFKEHNHEPRVGIRFRHRTLPTGQSEEYTFTIRPESTQLQRLLYGGGQPSKWPQLAVEAKETPLSVWASFRVSVIGDTIDVTVGPPFNIDLHAKDPNPIPEGIVALQSIKTSVTIRNFKIETVLRPSTAQVATEDDDKDAKSPVTKSQSPPTKSTSTGPLEFGPGALIRPDSSLAGLRMTKAKTSKRMWFWTNSEQHVLVVPYVYFKKDLNKALESIFGGNYQFFAVGAFNEFGKEPASFNYWESLTAKCKDGQAYGTIDPLDIIYKDLDGKIDVLEREKRENESLRVYLGFKVLDTYENKEIWERAKRQNLTSIEEIDKRNKVLAFQINSLKNVRELFSTLSVGPGEKKMCLMAIRSSLNLSKIDSMYLVLSKDEPQVMEPIQVSTKLMRECGIGSK